MKILVTGSAGFIGFHLINNLIANGNTVVGLDSINDYYSVNLKYDRLNELGIKQSKISENNIIKSEKYDSFRFVKLNLEDYENLINLFDNEEFDIVVNLAAQVGVRYSIENPFAYMQSNIIGFANILEACKQFNIKHLVYASSSSVYGLNENLPFSTHDNVDHPISLYAASKKSNELMAHTYSYLHNLPTTGLRFFTVYGPWGRPDMALFKFVDNILNSRPIDVYNNGHMERDFTYIDDIINGIVKVMRDIPKGNEKWNGNLPDPASSSAPYKLFNIGASKSVNLLDFIKEIEINTGKKAIMNMLPIQPGDVVKTHADISDLQNSLEYYPETNIIGGIKKFVDWYTRYYN